MHAWLSRSIPHSDCNADLLLLNLASREPKSGFLLEHLTDFDGVAVDGVLVTKVHQIAPDVTEDQRLILLLLPLDLDIFEGQGQQHVF